MRRVLGVIVVLALGLLRPTGASAQRSLEVDDELLHEIFPGAERLGPKQGSPPVFRAFATDPATGSEVLVGFVFTTPDVPPEESGYNAPIEMIVGLDIEGQITGVRVLHYSESLSSTRGDFLRNGRWEQQFAGKRLTDPFRVRRDVVNVSGATISVASASRGIRNAARRIAAAYLSQDGDQITPEEIEELSWPQLAVRGLGDHLVVSENGRLRIEVYLVPLADEAMGRILMGEAYDRALERLAERAAERQQWMIGVDGGLAALMRSSALVILRGSDTLNFRQNDLALAGEPRSGKVENQFRNVGLLLVDPSVRIDQAFTWRLDFGGGMQPASVEHRSAPRRANVVVAVPAPAETQAEPADADTAAEEPDAQVMAAPEGPAAAEPEPVAPLIEEGLIDFAAEADETVLERTLATTSWTRVGIVAALLALASAAFFAKLTWLRWVALGATLIVLGFAGGGFLSVSHITSGIKVGPGVYLEDLPLLLLVAFTVVTTLLWGRVFCGYLCPFGALQDFMEHVIPKRIRRKVKHPVHEGGLWVKYGVLGVVLVPAIAGSDISIFQYFEPFGTVFFLSPSMILWTIAGSILLASAIIPRFYCRYLCPLGASLALASVLSPFRIKRVQHCTVCTVCEHNCPTGAILREEIDFKECVRCNVCEVKLIERAGVCGHDLEEVSRLIQIRRGQDYLHPPGRAHRHRPLPQRRPGRPRSSFPPRWTQT